MFVDSSTPRSAAAYLSSSSSAAAAPAQKALQVASPSSQGVARRVRALPPGEWQIQMGVFALRRNGPVATARFDDPGPHPLNQAPIPVEQKFRYPRPLFDLLGHLGEDDRIASVWSICFRSACMPSAWRLPRLLASTWT